MLVVPANGELRVVCYNVAGSGGSARTGMSTVLNAICTENVNGIVRPIDLLILQEVSGNGGTENDIIAILNQQPDTGPYLKDTTSTYACDGRHVGLVYNSATVNLISAIDFRHSGACRDNARYQIRPVGYGPEADIYIYNTHLHSSDTSERLAAANIIRTNADGLAADAYVIYAGDFNIDSSSESSYQSFLSSGNGQAVDPINRPGTWHNNPSFKDIHTQAPMNNPPGGLIGGGIDDRFDFQLVSTDLKDGEGCSYIGAGIGDISAGNHSYHSFGNNGTHPWSSGAGNINHPSNTAQPQNVLDALTTASDHLPVVADFQLPARMQVIVDSIPNDVEQYTAVEIAVTIENIAPVNLPLGADELDYVLSTTGDIAGSATGSDAAAGSGNIHYITLDTSTIGMKTGQISVISDSQNASDPCFVQVVEFNVYGSNTPFCVNQPSTDLSGDCKITLVDFAMFAEQWFYTEANDPNILDIEPVITGIIDGTLSGGTPKAVEIYIPGRRDLSQYSIERSDSGGTWGNNTQLTGIYENTFVYLIGSDNNGEQRFNEVFGASGFYANRPLVSILINHNGNDAYRLIKDANVVDQVWMQNNSPVYMDSYMYRYDRTGPDDGFVMDNWYMPLVDSGYDLSGLDAAGIRAAVPFGDYVPPEGAQLPPCYYGYPESDFDESCTVDHNDLQELCTEWLECGLDPNSACW